MAKLDLSGPIAVIRNRLRNLAADLEGVHGEAAQIVIATTEAAAQDVRSIYSQHRVTGTLAGRVRVRYPSAMVGVVVSAAPHGTIFEQGTQPRFNKNGKALGRSPAHKVIATVAPGHRVRMKGRLKDLLIRHGLTVTD